MSRPAAKRQRFSRHASEENDGEDVFASSSTAHIFSASSSRLTSSSDVLHPCSYEITLNRDHDLKRSFQQSSVSTDLDSCGSRLVTWTSADGTQSVTTDRYDAVHLLSQLPARPAQSTKISETTVADDLEWSDLDSDTEDLFCLTDVEAAQFTHTKARAALDAQRSTRLAALSSPSPPTPEAISDASTGTKEKADAPALSRPQFELMQKTAKVIASSTNPSMLELKILANHGGDERFSFLRKDANKDSQSHAIWEALKASKGNMTHEAALQMVEPAEAEANKVGGGGLVAYDDSDSESEAQAEPVGNEQQAIEADKSEHKGGQADEGEADEAALKRRKQAERLARAKIWLQSRSSQPSIASQSS
ncbi:hypothetical protein PSEUBRA_004703 [Kalmanozyma brasiliensis GHG001]|uniref:uncharacterized protein n=1 Tax=Kalmanozyma brasiliensis (strain GHG001) TaxID=1365824 RepID=UPI002867E7D3|nr:uncharacterized protein PSEUBRA_004703 [Kalmanozyma brasiliensis GHG001]KAF6767415.1 hypothetical protein PSEUBRA_004703 [Kalmanozyma brasiliensis GHG001]